MKCIELAHSCVHPSSPILDLRYNKIILLIKNLEFVGLLCLEIAALPLTVYQPFTNNAYNFL